ncbi:helix-turn-helix transcriptional regulator [Kribbella sp. NPDC050459]|uniref:helix-turn-helix domain-containing protein n=1 Tax=Kribbella sp. NPDC050459 TaxID=3155785 RepID=UPI0033F637FB
MRLRRLAAELTALRADARLTREQVEEQTGVNQGTLWRIEKGQAKPHNGTLETLFDLYGVDDARRASLIELARDAKSPGWLRQYPHYSDAISDGYAAYISFESEAKSVNNYETSFIPGLLQTEDYARTVMLDGFGADTETVERRVQVRMERQRILSPERAGRDPLEFWAVVDEAVLRREVGGRGVMRAQLDRIQEMSDLPNVTVQVIPFDRGAYRGMDNSFSRLRFGATAPDIVHVEGLAGDLFLELEAEVDRFSLVFDHLRATALSPRDSRALLAASMAD